MLFLLQKCWDLEVTPHGDFNQLVIAMKSKIVLINGLTFHGKIETGNHRFSYETWDFPGIFPLNQAIDLNMDLNGPMGE